jgi:peroxiredoxin (alkyl hydroperoxide reductase subunit C)
MLTIGDKFPDFSLVASSSLPFEQLTMENAFEVITESSHPGQWKVVFFYPKDFTFVCPTEIVAFANIFGEFQKRNTQILGCSVDSEFVHWAWRKYNPALRHLPFSLMSDLRRELTGRLGILDQDSGVAHRALFIVDPESIIRFVMVTDPSVGRNPAEVLRVLDALQTGELCQCGWIRGQETINLKNAGV